jgi:hypothetical protein
MSLLHADIPSGFAGLYGTTVARMLNGIYAETNELVLMEDPDPTVAGNVCRFQASASFDGLLRLILPATNATVGMANRTWLANIPNSTGRQPMIHQFRNASNAALTTITVNPSGAIEARRGGEGGTLLGTSDPNALVANAWQHVETKVLFSSTVGTVEVRVEGVPVLELTGVNTSSSDLECGIVAWTNPGDGTGGITTWYAKDLLVWDGAGSVDNDFFGSVSIYALLTDADISLNWTPSTGSTGWDLLDESPPNDADYISAPDPAPAAAVMSLTNLPADVTSVRGLISFVRAAKTDGGDGDLQVSLTSGANTDAGADRPMTTAFTYWKDVSEVNPGTGVFWTPTEVDAMDIEFDRTV